MGVCCSIKESWPPAPVRFQKTAIQQIAITSQPTLIAALVFPPIGGTVKLQTELAVLFHRLQRGDHPPIW